LILEQIKRDIERAEAVTPSYWMKATQDSRGAVTEYGAACLAATLIERGEPVPPRLRPFIAALLRRVFHPAWETLAVLKDDNAPKAVRDLAVWVAVIEVCQKTELLPTRNVATDTPSACSIVAEVLRELGIDKGEALVEKIWRKLNKRDLRQKLDEALPLPPRRKN
jgi:hypothetical protein